MSDSISQSDTTCTNCARPLPTTEVRIQWATIPKVTLTGGGAAVCPCGELYAIAVNPATGARSWQRTGETRDPYPPHRAPWLPDEPTHLEEACQRETAQQSDDWTDGGKNDTPHEDLHRADFDAPPPPLPFPLPGHDDGESLTWGPCRHCGYRVDRICIWSWSTCPECGGQLMRGEPMGPFDELRERLDMEDDVDIPVGAFDDAQPDPNPDILAEMDRRWSDPTTLPGDERIDATIHQVETPTATIGIAEMYGRLHYRVQTLNADSGWHGEGWTLRGGGLRGVCEGAAEFLGGLEGGGRE